GLASAAGRDEHANIGIEVMLDDARGRQARGCEFALANSGGEYPLGTGASSKATCSTSSIAPSAVCNFIGTPSRQHPHGQERKLAHAAGVDRRPHWPKGSCCSKRRRNAFGDPKPIVTASSGQSRMQTGSSQPL